MALNNNLPQDDVNNINNEGTQNNEGNTNVTAEPTVPAVENNKGNTKTYSQSDVDEQMRKTRLATEKDAKKKLLAQLGLTLEDEDKLNAFKEAYQNSLSEEDKRNAELQNLQAEKLKLTQDLEEKDYVIKALIELTGKDENEVDKIVKMAKGLKTEDNTIEDAIKEVISMINVQPTDSNNVVKPNIDPNMPTSNAIQQPSTTVVDVQQENPFKAGQINLTKQGELLRTNPELAKKLAADAGVKLKF